MLSLAPASSCDICVHDYDDTVTVPHTIACGHVFCRSCIMQVQGPLACPLCRKPFEIQDVRRLHVSFDKGLLERLQCSTDDLRTAERFQKAMSDVADTGIAEKALRQLIQDMKAFLQAQPRNLFRDLRVTHRMMSFMCDVRANIRSLRQEIEKLNEEISTLTSEKESLQNKLKEEIELRKYEKETALAVEVSLREHCENANKVYNNAIEMVNTMLKEKAKMMSELEHVRMQLGSQQEAIIDPLKSLVQPNIAPEYLRGMALQDDDSFLISPLPQFTQLPASRDQFMQLPSLAEDGEEDEDDEDEVSTPNTLDHSEQMHAFTISKPQPPFNLGEDSSPPPPKADSRVKLEPSGLTRTAPYSEHRQQRARSSSSPSRPTSRDRSPLSSATGSRTTTPSNEPSSSNLTTRPTAARTGSSPKGEVLRSRLQDILRDGSGSVSASLPNISAAHFPTSLTSRDTHDSPEKPPRSTSDSAKTSMSTSDQFAQYLAPNVFASGLPNTMSPSNANAPRPGISSASDAAKKFEEEKRRKHREEKEKQAREREREREQQHDVRQERHGQAAKVSNSTTSSAGMGASSGHNSSRRDQSHTAVPLLYGPHPNAPGSAAPLRRGTPSAGTFSRSGPIPVSQDQGSGLQSRYPIPPSSKPPRPAAGIYA